MFLLAWVIIMHKKSERLFIFNTISYGMNHCVQYYTHVL